MADSPDASRQAHKAAIMDVRPVNGVTYHMACRGVTACPQIPRAAHSLMYCLLDAASDEGLVWLGQQAIAERTKFSVRSVRGWLRRLVDLGFLEPVYPSGRSSSGQRRWATTYRIHIDKLAFFDPLGGAHNRQEPAAYVAHDRQDSAGCALHNRQGLAGHVAHNRQDSVAQPASQRYITGKGALHNRQQLAANRLKTDLKTDLRPNTNTGASVEPVFPDPLNTDAFKAAWAEWVEYRRQSKKKLTPMSIKLQLKELSEFGHDDAILSIQRSIKFGWTGLFKPEGNVPGKPGNLPGASKADERRAAARKREYGEDDRPLPIIRFGPDSKGDEVPF